MTPYFDALDKARAMGREYAENGIAAGDTEPDESPLSGEWAGAVTVRDIFDALGGDFDSADEWEHTDVADHWEAGYYSAPWPIRN